MSKILSIRLFSNSVFVKHTHTQNKKRGAVFSVITHILSQF